MSAFAMAGSLCSWTKPDYSDVQHPAMVARRGGPGEDDEPFGGNLHFRLFRGKAREHGAGVGIEDQDLALGRGKPPPTCSR